MLLQFCPGKRIYPQFCIMNSLQQSLQIASPFLKDYQHPLLPVLVQVGLAVRHKVLASLRSQSVEQLSSVFREDQADTIYQIDRDVEDILLENLQPAATALGGIVLLAEGVGNEETGTLLGQGFTFHSARWRIIMDPIDGTRGIMYDKRSAWFLASAAENKGPDTLLANASVAVMVEIPNTRAALADVVAGVPGQGLTAWTEHLETGLATKLNLKPSKAPTLLGGFGQVARFFAPGREILARLEDTLIERLFPDAPEGRTLCFEDQYISTGGQLFQVMAGKDRYVADVRATLNTYLIANKRKKVFVCHPYDICTYPLAQMAGVEVTDAEGNPLNLTMNLHTPVDWIAYCNPTLRQAVEPHLLTLLQNLREGIL